jgi:DNA-binding HxlR family transcriptional regulator
MPHRCLRHRQDMALSRRGLEDTDAASLSQSLTATSSIGRCAMYRETGSSEEGKARELDGSGNPRREGRLEPRTGREAQADRNNVPWAIEAAAAPLCKRWKPAIIWLLGAGQQRYNGLAASLPGVTPKVLTEQLKDLVRDGLITREEVPGGGKHTEYALTALGETLLPVLDALEAWGREYERVHPKIRRRVSVSTHDTHASIPRADERLRTG